jgi:membrane associated rhomboid family serine protease
MRWKFILGLAGLLWLIELINFLLNHSLNQFGLIPRDLSQLWGIFTAPFLHGGVMHLSANTMPLLILGSLVLSHGFKRFLGASTIIIIVGGLALWQFGRPGVHVGASGLIFGLFGFLLANAWWERSLISLITAFFAVFFYGGMIFGILPSQPFVSWEGHLFGFLAGILSGALLHDRPAENQ